MISRAAVANSLGRLIRAVDRKSARLATDLHPQWIDAAWARLGPSAGTWAARVPSHRHSVLLASAYGIAWPSLAAFREPAHRIALLDRSQVLKVLAVCALDGRGQSVRRSVGRVVRDLLIEGIGENAYEKVRDGPTRGIRPASPLGMSEVGQEQLAADGFRTLCAQSAWRDRSLLTLVRLSLAPPTTRDNLLDDVSFGSSQPIGVDRTIDRLHDYFPELSWLFGSDMDRALSASTTESFEPPISPR